MERSNFFSYAGFHFKLCPIELRELFSYILNSPEFAKTVRAYLPSVREFVPVCTCNRFDMCFFGSVTKKSVGDLFFALALQALKIKCSHISHNPEKLKEHILSSMRFEIDSDGLILFLKVASSLDSLVLGETQILGQLKNSYTNAQKNGFIGKNATKIFNFCFKVSKRIRNETDLFKNVISIGHLAVEFAKKEFADISDKKIVIFGAGEMATLTARHFLHTGTTKLFIANRTFQNAKILCQKIAKGIPLELNDALDKIATFDICVVACGGDELILKEKYFTNYDSVRTHKALFIDISMPRKIDASLSSVENIILFNVDQLTEIVEHNKELRKNSLQKVEMIILNEVDEFLKRKNERESIQSVCEFNAWLKTVVQAEVDRFLNHKIDTTNKKMSSSIIARSVCKKVGAKMRYQNKI